MNVRINGNGNTVQELRDGFKINGVVVKVVSLRSNEIQIEIGSFQDKIPYSTNTFEIEKEGITVKFTGNSVYITNESGVEIDYSL